MKEITKLLSELVDNIENDTKSFNKSDLQQVLPMKERISNAIKTIEREKSNHNNSEDDEILQELLVRLNFIDIQF